MRNVNITIINKMLEAKHFRAELGDSKRRGFGVLGGREVRTLVMGVVLELCASLTVNRKTSINKNQTVLLQHPPWLPRVGNEDQTNLGR